MTSPIRPKFLPFLEKNSREILIGFCVLLVVFVRIVFPAKTTGEFFWINLFLFLVFPWLVVFFLLKENLRSFGFSTSFSGKWIAYSAAFVAAFVFLNYFIARQPGLREHLRISPGIVGSFWAFLWFQIAISLPAHFSWEFFFRGFFQFGLEKKIGKSAVLLQAAAQTLLFAKSPWIIIFLIGSSALFAGAIAQKSRSIFYSFVSMWLISISLDIMMIRLIHRGTL